MSPSHYLSQNLRSCVLFTQVIAAAGSDEKCELAMQRGAQASVNYSRGGLREAVRKLVGSGGVNVVVDTVGGDIFLEALHRCLCGLSRAGWTWGSLKPLQPCLPSGLASLSTLLLTFPAGTGISENS